MPSKLWTEELFNGIQFRVVRWWDPVRNEYKQRMGRVCECGQMIPYFVQIEPLGTDWEAYDPD